MPITQSGRTTTKHLVEVTIRPSALAKPAPFVGERKEWQNLKKGKIVTGWIHQITVNDMWIQLSSTVRGRVYILDASNDLKVLTNIKGSFTHFKQISKLRKVLIFAITDHFRPGQGVKCMILGFDAKKQELDLSLKAVNKTPSKVRSFIPPPFFF